MDSLSKLLLRLIPAPPLGQQLPQTPYEWTKLADPTSMVRLMLLYPEKTGPLRCSVFDVTLDNAPKYEAISYHWGDPTPKHELQIGDRCLRIARSIFEVLHRARKWDQFRFLWIDGVCISQVDLAEKSQQILMMNQIFRQATTVLVYLGPEADDSHYLPALFDRIERAATMKGLSLSTMDERYEGALLTEEYVKFGLPQRSSPIWSRLQAFCIRPYFRRIWIVQEVVLAKEISILCGKWEMLGTKFAFSMYLTTALGLPITLTTESDNDKCNVGLSIWQQAWAFRDFVKHSDKYEFVYLLRALRKADATDDRDKIYGLLALGEAFGGQFPPPDYGKDKIAVYHEYARHFVSRGHGLELLYNVAFEPSWKGPSWVPNWTTKALRSDLAPETLSRSPSLRAYAASPLPRSPISLEAHGSRILVAGLFVDTVKRVTTLYSPDERSFFDGMLSVDFLTTQLEDFWRLDCRDRYPTIESRDEAIWRTMVCNKGRGTDYEISPQYGQYWRKLKEIFAHMRDKKSEEWGQGCSESSAVMEWETNFHGISHEIRLFSEASLEHCTTRLRCTTTTGSMGQVPPFTKQSDQIFIPCGSSLPFVLRPKGLNYIVIGPCYIHGIMKGEAFINPTRTIEQISIM